MQNADSFYLLVQETIEPTDRLYTEAQGFRMYEIGRGRVTPVTHDSLCVEECAEICAARGVKELWTTVLSEPEIAGIETHGRINSDYDFRRNGPCNGELQIWESEFGGKGIRLRKF